ncbi:MULTISPECIES: hypothetical protein [Cyanophyceae]|uniref:hypothetical protein n=1 Tax=Cyanophyceae TaxID=3028117 RepID=UPI001682F7BC|nr:hypothetical protein [Trichocoleus sp. FACHB-40]MBD2001701.1 hypothetical protein [Trichocoleus sp. FACHB-40]
MGQRNPLQLFNDSLKESVAPEPSTDAPQEDSRIMENESLIKIHESGKNNQDSGFKIQDSGKAQQESEDTKVTPLYPLSVRIPEPLNDALDDAVKQTRRSMGRKIRKEVLVSLAIEAMLQRVKAAGGWREIASEEELRELLGLHNE